MLHPFRQAKANLGNHVYRTNYSDDKNLVNPNNNENNVCSEIVDNKKLGGGCSNISNLNAWHSQASSISSTFVQNNKDTWNTKVPKSSNSSSSIARRSSTKGANSSVRDQETITSKTTNVVNTTTIRKTLTSSTSDVTNNKKNNNIYNLTDINLTTGNQNQQKPITNTATKGKNDENNSSINQKRSINKHFCETNKSAFTTSSNSPKNFSTIQSTMRSSASSSESTTCSGSCSDDGETSTTSSGEPNLPYPGFPEVALKYLTQTTKPRNWCLRLITNPWFERVSILVILLNCVTLGMYQPCVDDECVTNRCKILEIFDDIIFAFFALEMTIKMVAMGIYGKNTYLADSWNRLDFFIVFAGGLEYVMHVENLNLTAIRTIRVLRPLRAINRIPSMRILVMLLLDTLPMLGNVLLLCFFVFFIFGIVGVQLWEGILRQRCVLQLPPNVVAPKGLHDEYRVRVRVNSISLHYEFSKEQDYICSKPNDSGMHLCQGLPKYRIGAVECNASALPFSMNQPTAKSCVDWNKYYTNCTQLGSNPFQGTISFDNIGLAWVAIFLVISLEGWTDIMYYVQDAHSFWDWIYFVLLIVIGSFFMINLCLVVIATQFSETKKREMERMRQERARYTSTSTLASSTNNSEPATCYAEIVKYIAHLWRKTKRRLLKKYRLHKSQMAQRKEGLLPNSENFTFSPSRIKAHHPQCPNLKRKPSNIQEQMIAVMFPLNSNNNLNVQNSNISTNKRNNNHGSSNGQNSLADNSENSMETSKNSNLKKNNVKDELNQKTILLKIPTGTDSEQLINPCTSGFLSPPTSARRRSSVMFNEYVILHTPPTISETAVDKNICLSEKMTQAGDGSIWQVTLPQTIGSHAVVNSFADCSELSLNDAMTCQELLAFSVAFSAALPTGQSTLESFYSSLTRSDQHGNQASETPANVVSTNSNYIEDYSCCYGLYQNTLCLTEVQKKKRSKGYVVIVAVYKFISKIFSFIRKYVKILVEHKYFQQGILLAILINTLSMGIEYHNQPEGLTVIVETSNIVFSAIFAVEMLLKVIAEGPFRYVANGFNVFDGIIVVLSVIELCQQFIGERTGGGNSGLSVLRTFRLLRILKLVRFMPNLRRQLFVMLRTMDNVAVFFSLLVLFIFIFSILGMNLFGCKFCEKIDNEVQCDRKNFDSLLWALVTVFQILTQEDWNVVLFNGMEKTSHWAALYFVALMTFGNYVLFNLLVAILVEGFSSERNERREREQRELVKKLREENMADNFSDVICDESRSSSDSTSTNESYYEIKNKWRSAEELRKQLSEANVNEKRPDPKCNLQKQILLQPSSIDYQSNEGGDEPETTQSTSGRKSSHRSKMSESSKSHSKGSQETCISKERSDINKIENLRPLRDPPIIMTTAATPQDSPNTTLESGATFKNWSQQELETNKGIQHVILKSRSTPSLLKPPTLLSAHKMLNERLPLTELSVPLDQMSFGLEAHSISSSRTKQTTASNLSTERFPAENTNWTGAKVMTISKASGVASLDSPTSATMPSGILVTESKMLTSLTANGSTTTTKSTSDLHQRPTLVSTNISEQPNSTGDTSKTLEREQSGSNEQIEKCSGFKRFRRTTSKKKAKSGANIDRNDINIVLNNGRDSVQKSLSRTMTNNDSLLKSASRIQNDTKDTSRSSPQSSIRCSSSPSRRALCVFNKSQFYQNLNHHAASKAYTSRRMSSIELVLEKASNTNIYNMENQKSMMLHSSKLDLEKWQKSLSTINVSNGQQQQQQQQQQRQLKHRSTHHHQSSNNNNRQSQSIRSFSQQGERVSKIKALIQRLKPTNFTNERESFSLYIFPEDNQFRHMCMWFVTQKWFDNVVLLFIALNCITLAMERPNIPPTSTERFFLSTANYIFTVVFTFEMFIKVVATGMFYGPDAYFTSGWNIMDGSLVIISIIDLLMSLISESSPRIFGILRVFRLLRSLRPLRVINRAPGLKLVVQTLLSSLRPIGNIVLICCTFFIIFGILGVQLFKGTFYYCEGENIRGIRNKTDCIAIYGTNAWVNRKYNFDDLGKALMSLFVLSSRDGWVNIMYTGLDAVGVDQQPIVNYNEWRLLYFIAFILLVGFFVLNMFVGVVVENFHRCREEQEKEEKIRRAAKRALQMEKKRRKMHEPPYYTNYSQTRMFVHNVVTSKYFDLAIAAVIGLNVVTMAMEYYMMPVALEYALKIFNYFFTAVFILEAMMKSVALGMKLYMKDKWNQLDVGIVILSIVGIILEELKTNIIPINPTIIRVMRVLRIARVLKLLKMAKGIRALLDTVMQALPQVGNLGLLFFLLFFIFAALGVELFGRLDCTQFPCQGLGEHAHFANFGMAFLTLFRVATGDNWNGIMKDTLRDDPVRDLCSDAADCVKNCCVSTIIAPIFFVIFVLMAQFVLVNVVVAVLMKHLEESHKQMEDEMDMDTELEREFVREQEFEEEQALCLQLEQKANKLQKRPLDKVSSLPSNFTYSTPSLEKKFNAQRRQTIQYYNQSLAQSTLGGGKKFRSTAMYNNDKKSIWEDTVTENTLNNDSDMSVQSNLLNCQDMQFQLANKGLKAKPRPSLFRAKMMSRERSLDEHGIRRRRLETKRMSCDNLPWRSETKSDIIFESNEGENMVDFDIRSVQSVNCTGKKFESPSVNEITVKLPLEVALKVPKSETTPREQSQSSQLQLQSQQQQQQQQQQQRKPFTRSASTDQGNPQTKPSFLSVPSAMPPRSRSGSTKQLFKQQALDEDHDMDESSLLLPVASRQQHQVVLSRTEFDKNISEKQDPLSRTSSTEILRIIAERRRLDKQDNSANGDSDYNELLLLKSPQTSVDT